MACVLNVLKAHKKRKRTSASLRGLTSWKATELERKRFLRWELAMRKRVETKAVPGYATCVIRRGAVVHTAEYGMADLEGQTPFTKDTIVRLYCVTKTVVSVAILMLMEEGKLKLSDPVSKYLPAFKDMKRVRHGNCSFDTSGSPNVAHKVTILRILTHTAGFGYGCDFGEEGKDGHSLMYKELLAAVDDRKMTSLEQYCDELGKLPLRYEPGKKLEYSMGHDVLGRIIEVVSGKTLGAFLETEIFKPLGMRDTAFFVPRRKAMRLAGLYCDRSRAERVARVGGTYAMAAVPPKGQKLHRIDGSMPAESNWIEGRQCTVSCSNGILGTNMGGLVSTLNDCARFFTTLSNGGILDGHRILQTSTVEELCFNNLLPLPTATGTRKRTSSTWAGWSAIGERGLKPTKLDPPKGSDEYEEGEVAMGGAAGTCWSVNPVRDTVQLHFTQALDSSMWRPDRKRGKSSSSSPENLTNALRSLFPRDEAAAARRRAALSSKGKGALKKRN